MAYFIGLSKWTFAALYVLALVVVLAVGGIGPLLAPLLALAIAIPLFLVAAGGAVIARNIAREKVRRRRILTGPNSIALEERVRVGGIDQFIEIRGRDRRNPIILFLHGGPGASELPFSHMVQDEWEKHFVCVQWEQRGAGRTFAIADKATLRETLTLETMTSDALEVIDFVLRRLGQEKLFLHGHSWGSALGMMVAKRVPEKLHAYVGEGQVVSMLLNEQVSYDFTVDEAKRFGEKKALRQLKSIGRPPYPVGKYMASATIQRAWLSHFGFGGIRMRKTGLGGRMFNGLYRALLTCPSYKFSDVTAWTQALGYTGSAFTTGKAEYLDFDLRAFDRRYAAPIFFFNGRMDYVTPSIVADAFFAEIEAPVKKQVWFEHSAHSPQREESEKYLEAFLTYVAPLARRKDKPAIIESERVATRC